MLHKYSSLTIPITRYNDRTEFFLRKDSHFNLCFKQRGVITQKF